MLWLLACAGTEPAPDTTPTWTEDVQPLFAEHCAACHASAGLAGFPLDTYDEVIALASVVATSVEDRSMPPFLADNSGECTTYSPARWLTEDEIATVVDWVDGDTPYGPEFEPVEPTPVQDLEATHVFTTAQPYTPTFEGWDDWRCFVVEPGLEQDMFLRAYQVVPQNRDMVHHVAIFKPISDLSAAQVRSFDPDGEGYRCFGGANTQAGLWAIWSPGQDVYRLPGEAGVPIEAGMPLVLQFHYAPVEGEVPAELTEVRVELTTDAPPLLPLWVLNDDFELDPDTPNNADSQSRTLREMMQELGWDDYAESNVALHGVGGHMHLMGTSLRAEVQKSTGDECLMDIKRWDYDWHDIYMLEEPISAGPDDVVNIDCTWDTTGRDEPVYWGDDIEDEMCTILVLAEPTDPPQ
ncbi:MAG: hypothetical protein GY884_30495 [Proteobacteria bacterium]|nr:hypothetical protein [Pseudomonadota bacterium]